ncbi:hypothetical protein pb186bvf_008701 [Paramecium bursaria]
MMIILVCLNLIPEIEPKQPENDKILESAISYLKKDESISSHQELLNIFPQGIALINIDKDFQVEFANTNMYKLLGATNKQNLLKHIVNLDKQQQVEQKEVNQQPNHSISSFNSFQGTQIPTNPFRSPRRSMTNKIPHQKVILMRHGSMRPSIQNQEQIANDSDNLIWIDIITMQSFLNKKEVINQMRNNQQYIQLHNTILGYKIDGQQKKRCIEIKLYNALLNDTPLILLLARDVTYRDYISSLQDYSQQKSKTLMFVSHEYRTPLNCIIDMLQDCQVEEQTQSQTVVFDSEVRRKSKSFKPHKVQRMIKIALNNAKYLQSLSDDLLDLAQMKVGEFKIHKTKFNFTHMINSCLDLFQVTAERSNVKLILNYDNRSPKTIYSDENRLKQVIINLLGNAFKFTEEGSVTVRVQLDLQNKLLVQVIDTGCGITVEDQTNLFQAFGKGNSDENKKLNVKGVGLGLLISNQILQVLNNDVQNGLKFSSQYQKGSTFYFSINYHDPSDIQSLNSMEERNQDSEQSIDTPFQEINKVYVNQNSFMKRSTKAIISVQILVVDDNHFNLEAMKRTLDQLKRGIDLLDTAINGAIAIKQVNKKWETSKEFYKIIFMDLEMPGRDGIQTAKIILQMAQERNQQINIIGCSAHDQSYKKAECLKIGMKDYLTKPVSKIQMGKILQQYL